MDCCMALKVIFPGAVGDWAVVQDCKNRVRATSDRKAAIIFLFNRFIVFLLDGMKFKMSLFFL